MKSLTALMLAALTLSGCSVNLRGEATATEAALCRAWGESLPTLSRSDTEQTKREVWQSYADFANACPANRDLIPE